MRYMMIVKATKDSEAGAPPNPELMAAIAKLAEDASKRGVMVGAGGLQPSSRGTRIRVSGGKTSVIDGPFAETKELVGGYWLIQVKSLEEAIEWAKRSPVAPNQEAEIEVREFIEFESVLSQESLSSPP